MGAFSLARHRLKTIDVQGLDELFRESTRPSCFLLELISDRQHWPCLTMEASFDAMSRAVLDSLSAEK